MSKKGKTRTYLTPIEVADFLMISRDSVRKWSEKGELKAMTTPGGHRRYLRTDIEEYARSKGLMEQKGALKVLIVDDDQASAALLNDTLEDSELHVVSEIAIDGFDAGQKVRDFNPDIVLMDLMMPGLDGFEVCHRLKTNKDTAEIRVIAITGHPTPENIKKITAVGAEACLSKPLDFVKLLELIGEGVS